MCLPEIDLGPADPEDAVPEFAAHLNEQDSVTLHASRGRMFGLVASAAHSPPGPGRGPGSRETSELLTRPGNQPLPRRLNYLAKLDGLCAVHR